MFPIMRRETATILWIALSTAVVQPRMSLASTTIQTLHSSQHHTGEAKGAIKHISRTIASPSLSPTSLQSPLSCKDLSDSTTFRFEDDPTKDCATWVAERPIRRCRRIDPLTNQLVRLVCPRMCKKVCRKTPAPSIEPSFRPSSTSTRPSDSPSSVPTVTANPPRPAFDSLSPSHVPSLSSAESPTIAPTVVVPTSDVPTIHITRSSFPSPAPQQENEPTCSSNDDDDDDDNDSVATGRPTTKWILFLSSGAFLGIVLAFCGGLSRGKMSHQTPPKKKPHGTTTKSLSTTADPQAPSSAAQTPPEDDENDDHDSQEVSFKVYSINECFACDCDDEDYYGNDDSWSMSAVSSSIMGDVEDCRGSLDG